VNIRFTRRRLLGAAGSAVVAVLILGSVQTTGATWFDKSTVNGSTITAGTLALSPGSGSSPSFTFPALTGSGVIPGQQVQASLNITNTGSTNLTYKLNSAGPQVSSGGPVVVNLSGAVTTTCGPGPLPGPTAFTAFDSSAPGTVAASSPRPLAVGASETWCIRAMLQSVSGAGSATYTVNFTFGANQA
jgi:alternate signal-mediated exported protein